MLERIYSKGYEDNVWEEISKLCKDKEIKKGLGIKCLPHNDRN
jgi:hypothetical protein